MLIRLFVVTSRPSASFLCKFPKKMWVVKNTIKPCTPVRISLRILPSFVFQLPPPSPSLQQLARNKKAAFTSTPRRVLIRITRVPFFFFFSSSSTPFSNRDWETRIDKILVVKVGNTPNLEFLSPLYMYIYIVSHTLGTLSRREGNSWQGSLPARWARKRGSESSVEFGGPALRRSEGWV